MLTNCVVFMRRLTKTIMYIEPNVMRPKTPIGQVVMKCDKLRNQEERDCFYQAGDVSIRGIGRTSVYETHKACRKVH